MDRVPSGLLSAGARAVASVSPYRRLFLEKLKAAHDANKLLFFGDLERLADRSAFGTALAPLRRIEWLVYAKRPFAGPEQVLAYLARYTLRVAIFNHRLLAIDDDCITFSCRDYRHGARTKSIRLEAQEFIRRFLLHVLPSPSPSNSRAKLVDIAQAR
jgi:putative transposase